MNFPEEYFNSVGGVIVTLSSTGAVTGWSAGAERFSGYSAAAALGKNWWEFCPVEFHPQAAEHAVTLRERGELQLQQPFVHRDGRLRWLEALVVSRVAGGEGFLLLGRDVSRLRVGRTEPAEGWKGLVEAVSDGAMAVDEAGRVVVCNEALAQMLGLERTEVNGQLLANTPTLLAIFRQAMGRASSRSVEVMGQRRDGALLSLTALASTVEINGRRLAIAVFRAPAPAAATDTAMFQADRNRAISLLSRGVAHDFNNIFAAILSHLDLVRTAAEVPAGLRENLELAQASARRGADLVGKLQTFSSQAAPHLETMDLRSWVTDVFALLRRSLGTDATVRLVPAAAGLWPVRGDGNQILQVLINLCLIAREAVSRAGEIVIRVENVVAKQPPKAGSGPGDFVVLAVAGLGPGQAVGALGALTARASDGLDGAKNGGLGLSIADNICAGHGGWLEVERRAGVGTEFRVFLPRANRGAGGPVAEASAPLAAAGASVEGTETILVVDDEAPLRMLMRAVLGYRGYQIIEAGSGEEALEKYAAATGAIGVVLMDLNLPGMSGWDAMARLRAQNPRLPVVVLSGGYAEEESRRAKTLGAADFVSKPFDNLELVQTVRRVLDAAVGRG